MTDPVVTLARQFGSGGHEVGEKLAARLGIPLYDREILLRAAQQSGISAEMFCEADEKPGSSLIYSLSIGAGKGAMFADFEQKMQRESVFSWQCRTIRELADKGPCVIIGRCADDILRGRPGLVSVYVHSPLEIRVQRIARMHNIDEDAARDLVRKTDKTRANYYSFYTDREWDAAANYDLCLNTARLGVEGAVEMIAEFLENCR